MRLRFGITFVFWDNGKTEDTGTSFLFHVVEDGAYDSSDDSAFYRVSGGFARKIFFDSVRQLCDRESL